jgi:hypothetical protein
MLALAARIASGEARQRVNPVTDRLRLIHVADQRLW